MPKRAARPTKSARAPARAARRAGTGPRKAPASQAKRAGAKGGARAPSRRGAASPKRSRASPKRPTATGRRSAAPPKRASPAPKGVRVQRPKAHQPTELKASLGGFEVHMDAAPARRAAAAPAPQAAETTGPAAPGRTAPRGGLTYAQTGVDIHKEDKAIDALASMVSFHRKGFGAPMGRIGHFAGLVDFGPEHALVLCTDGVGSKVEIANAIRKWDTVGIDCMAMNVNDALCVGAEPLAFVDYLAVEDPEPELTRQVGIGLNEGARQANCSLIGGETASLPGIIKGFDLAGTCLAHVRKDAIIDGTKIRPGDAIIGLASTGIHSNGYSLARRAFESAGHKYTAPWPWPEDKEHAGKSIGEVLLVPTRIYVREVMELLRSGIPVHGLSHITGSGLRKLRRIHQGVRYDITDPLPVHTVFRRVQQLGGVDDHEMHKTFNMGMGFCVVVPAPHAKKAVALLRSLVPYQVKVVGKVSEGTGVHHPVGGVH